MNSDNTNYKYIKLTKTCYSRIPLYNYTRVKCKNHMMNCKWKQICVLSIYSEAL